MTTNTHVLKTLSRLHEKCLDTHFGAGQRLLLSSERNNTILLVLPDHYFQRRTPGHNGGALVCLQPHLVHLCLCGRGRTQEDRQLPAGDGLQLPRQGSVQSSLVLVHFFDTRSDFDCSVFSWKVTAVSHTPAISVFAFIFSFFVLFLSCDKPVWQAWPYQTHVRPRLFLFLFIVSQDDLRLSPSSLLLASLKRLSDISLLFGCHVANWFGQLSTNYVSCTTICLH